MDDYDDYAQDVEESDADDDNNDIDDEIEVGEEGIDR